MFEKELSTKSFIIIADPFCTGDLSMGLTLATVILPLSRLTTKDYQSCTSDSFCVENKMGSSKVKLLKRNPVHVKGRTVCTREVGNKAGGTLFYTKDT